MVQIQSDIVLAFILLVMFNFGMNLFLFYKWHKEINSNDEVEFDEDEDYLEQCLEQARYLQTEISDKAREIKTSTPAYDLGKK